MKRTSQHYDGALHQEPTDFLLVAHMRRFWASEPFLAVGSVLWSDRRARELVRGMRFRSLTRRGILFRPSHMHVHDLTPANASWRKASPGDGN